MTEPPAPIEGEAALLRDELAAFERRRDDAEGEVAVAEMVALDASRPLAEREEAAGRLDGLQQRHDELIGEVEATRMRLARCGAVAAIRAAREA